MKSICYLVATALCAGTPAMTQETPKQAIVQTVSNSYSVGSDVVQTVRNSDYSQFLKDMDDDYLAAKKANQLEGLIEIRKESGKVKINPEFAKSYGIIQKAKNSELLNAVSKAEDSSFVTKVRSAAHAMPDVEPELLAVSYKAPGTGKNADENTLIEISLEYYYKTIHLDSLGEKQTKEKHIALEIEKMDKMVAASKTFTDKKLKKAVEEAAAQLDERMAKAYDTSDLLALSRGKIKATSPLEEKVASIVSDSQGELADLHRQLLISLSK